MAPTTPKLRVPLEMGTTGFRAVEQGSDDEVAACVYALVATERGSRIEEGDYGVEDPTFSNLPLDTDEWLAQIGIYEPRAQVVTAEDIEAELIKVGVVEGES